MRMSRVYLKLSYLIGNVADFIQRIGLYFFEKALKSYRKSTDK